ncbi:MAG: hypothetical protein CL927_15890, partial [Deltaproteobacteria bacterium]|nr:hypothetical protein [Deltaproteobacteria bacterium]
MLDRLWVLASVGHLFTDVNPAEYGFLSVIAEFSDRSVFEQLADPKARADLLHACRLVGNQMHGTLGALGVVMLAWVEATGVVLGTGLLRGVALTQSTLTVGLWMVGLWRATGSSLVLVVFAAAATLGPPVWLGLNLLCWGTHETVGLIQAMLVCVALPWMAHPASEGQQGLRTVGMGFCTGLAALLNPALALPAVSATLGVAMARWICHPSLRALQTALLTVMVAALVGVGVLQWVLSTGWLDGLGYPRGLPLDRLTGFIGKNGGPLLHTRADDVVELARWRTEARARAFIQAPTAAYGVFAAQAEWATRLVILGTGVLAVSLVGRRGDEDSRGSNRAAAWLGIHLVVGLLATLWLTRHTSLDPTVPTGAPSRYFAHLYPFGFAVLSMVAGLRTPPIRRILAVAATGWVLWVGAFEHWRSVDPARLDATELAVALRYDGATAWFTDRPDPMPPV